MGICDSQPPLYHPTPLRAPGSYQYHPGLIVNSAPDWLAGVVMLPQLDGGRFSERRSLRSPPAMSSGLGSTARPRTRPSTLLVRRACRSVPTPHDLRGSRLRVTAGASGSSMSDPHGEPGADCHESDGARCGQGREEPSDEELSREHERSSGSCGGGPGSRVPVAFPANAASREMSCFTISPAVTSRDRGPGVRRRAA